VVQEPSDALIRSMPLSALDNVAVDYKLPAAEIGGLLARLAREPAAEPVRVAEEEDEKTRHEIRMAKEREALEEEALALGKLSPFTCPECHGVLTMLREGKIVRFRCHTGHAFSADTLLASSGEELEARLWDAVRAADESMLLLNHLGEQFAKSGNTAAAGKCFDQAREVHERVAAVREAALGAEQVDVEKLREKAAG
jgi:two-component system chemotaxis response regulator CheB